LARGGKGASEGDTAAGAAVLTVATAAADAADAAISIACLVSRHAVGYTPCTAAWAAALAAARTVPTPLRLKPVDPGVGGTGDGMAAGEGTGGGEAAGASGWETAGEGGWGDAVALCTNKKEEEVGGPVMGTVGDTGTGMVRGRRPRSRRRRRRLPH